MKPRLTILNCSRETDLPPSNYSTERSPDTELLFDGKRTVLLPVLHQEGEAFAVEVILAQTAHRCEIRNEL